jgi:hypothetical protein
MFDTHKDDVFMLSGSSARRHQVAVEDLAPFHVGDEIRDWQLPECSLVLKPYDERWKLRKEEKGSPLFRYLRAFRHELGGRATFAKGTYDEAGEPWYRYHQMSVEKITAPYSIVYPEIATHAHFLPQQVGRLFTQTAPLFCLEENLEPRNMLMAALVNSSSALLWLKQVCFSKREAEQAMTDTYYEFAGGKVQQIPIPRLVGAALKGQTNALAACLTKLSQACWERGQQLPGLALKKLFEKPGEAYHSWDSALPGYDAPNPAITVRFDSTEALRERLGKAQEIREHLRSEMIALQEEMDWLVYSCYGLLTEDHPAVSVAPLCERRDESSVIDRRYSEPLDREQRPFRFWEKAEGDYSRAVAALYERRPDSPVTDRRYSQMAHWPEWRKKLWEARLAAIRDNEHIRRIEQPVYKRRWDEQWKVGNQWRCGPVAYAAEFIDAFEWWLREKAEWWMENKKNGGPVELTEWTQALWKDSRIQAAWPVAVENYALMEADKNREESESPQKGKPEAPESLFGDYPAFQKAFKRIIDEETVPEGFPFGISYDDLENKLKKTVPAKLTKVRGKLNVPRERFHLRDKAQYLWAGLQFR